MPETETSPPVTVQKRTHLTLPILNAVNSFLFLWLSFFFLPDSVVKVLGSAAGAALGVFGLKGLNPREASNPSSPRQRDLFVGILLILAALQVALLCIGYSNPCRVSALPGSTVFVDGKFLERTPDVSELKRKATEKLASPENIRPWLEPETNFYPLRWDTHEIKVTKKWYVDKERSQESIKNVRVNYRKVFSKPNEAFADWEMKSEQKVMFKIDYGISNQLPGSRTVTDSSLSPTFSEEVLRDLVEEWDRIWAVVLNEGISVGHNRTEPYVAAIELVKDHSSSHLEFQIRDWTNRPLKPLRPIPEPRPQQVGGSHEISEPDMLIREDIYRQLLDELGIQQKIKPSEAVLLGEKLTTEVKTSQARPIPSPSATAVPLATPATSPSLPINQAAEADAAVTIKKIEEQATEAASKNNLRVAVAAQQQLKAASGKFSTTLNLSNAIKISQDVVTKAIKDRSGKGRIYIHIADESQRAPAAQLEPLFKQSNFVVVGIQNVGGRAYIPDTAEVRYFADPQIAAAKQAAEEIVAILKKSNVAKPRPSYVVPSVRDKAESVDINTHFEIWFARDSFTPKTAN